MYKVYERNADGTIGALVAETDDPLMKLPDTPFGAIVETEVDNRVTCSWTITEDYLAPWVELCKHCGGRYCTECELHTEDCPCYHNWYAENKGVERPF